MILSLKPRKDLRYNHLSNLLIITLSLLFIFSILTLSSCSSLNKDDTTDNSSSPSPEVKKGNIYYSQGTQALIEKNYTKALKFLLEAHKLNPKDSNINNNLGMTYFFKGKNELALQHIQKSIELDPKNSDARCNLASMYVTMKKYQLAEKEYQTVSRDLTYQHQYRVLYNLGIIKLRSGLFEEAKKYFEMSLKENEEYCPANYALGELAYDSKNLKEAYNYFYASSKGLCYNEPAPHYYQAKILAQSQKYLRAKEKFIDITTRFPKSEFAELSKKELKSLNSRLSLQDYNEIIPPKSESEKESKNENESNSTYDVQNF
ncbi:MAG: tetratricopeptide repeat protein [Oligoflexia bacterium]|nr:tetratricopeptide repeat protein [Oligoflexia bacterium]